MSDKQASDSVLRAMTDDGAFRVITTRTTSTVRGAVAAQSAKGSVAARFGELITGTLIIREAMAPGLRVQGIWKNPGGGSLVADSHPDGTSRGLINFGVDRSIDVGSAPAGSLLQMMRTMPSGVIQQGVIEVPAPGGISTGLMTYMQESEQVVSMIAVATIVDDDRVVASGGYLVQLLPEASRGPLMVMTERLADFTALEELLVKSDASPDVLLDELLYGMAFSRVGSSPLSFGCRCSELRLLETLATLPRSDLAELVESDQLLEIRCDYCSRDYAIAPSRLRPLLIEA